jgi:hypothetical protein
VDFQWARENLCERGRSPLVRLSGIPEGTIKLKAWFKDLNMPTYNHGGGTVENDGTSIIAAGALKGFRGPCPPIGLTHRYMLTVQALDAGGKVLALGKKTVPCNRGDFK